MSHQVRPLERRKYMLKSLDQIETVNGGGAALLLQERYQTGFFDPPAISPRVSLSQVSLLRQAFRALLNHGSSPYQPLTEGLPQNSSPPWSRVQIQIPKPSPSRPPSSRTSSLH